MLADKMTSDKIAQMRQDANEQENMLKLLVRGQMTTAGYERKQTPKGKKREVDLNTMQRAEKAGKQSRKILLSHPYQK